MPDIPARGMASEANSRIDALLISHGTSDNNLSNALLAKLNSIEAGAQVNTVNPPDLIPLSEATKLVANDLSLHKADDTRHKTADELKIYHANLSTVGSSYDVVIENVIYHLQYVGVGTISVSLRAVSGSFLVDTKRSTQYDLTGVEGSTLNNFTLTTTNQSLDALIYDSSNEMHRTWIRQQDPISKLWSLHEVNLFPSANGARTDIWVYKIYKNINY